MSDPNPNQQRNLHLESSSVEALVISHVSLPEAVHSVLRRRILNNELVEGERLVEAKIAEEFGVSRTTLRSALQALASENLVEVSSRRGCFVARMNAEAIREACFARYLLESGVASDDRSWFTPELAEALEAQINEMGQAALDGDVAAIVDADTAFHGIIVSASGHQRVTELWHTLDGQMGSLMRSSLDRQGIELDEIVQRHRLVVEALRSGEIEAIKEAIRVHYLDPTPKDD
jgi:DNA-binding GntR family transcriptional regulator